MALELADIVLRVGAATYLYSMSLRLEPAALNVLLGATHAGKTTLLRIMAGLDPPTSGRVLDGRRATSRGVPVRQRNVAMVYQQFINYPSMTVYDNIASPLRSAARRISIRRVARAGSASCTSTPYLDRLPAELSGGQQQRMALARALAKIRAAAAARRAAGQSRLQAARGVAARNWPSCSQPATRRSFTRRRSRPKRCSSADSPRCSTPAGCCNTGRTADVFHAPDARFACARVQRPADEPDVGARRGRRHRAPSMDCVCPLPACPRGAESAFRRPARERLRVSAATGRRADRRRRSQLAEIIGSETFVHVARAMCALVAQLPGVHRLDAGRASVCTASRPQLSVRRRRPARCLRRTGSTPALTWRASTSISRIATSRCRTAMRTTHCCR